jgi:myo-inositol 2-dehydrogenase / D-chiro-inositol 1-dehydrogenase
MSVLRLNRRRFLGCSAAAGLALAQAVTAEGDETQKAIRLGFIGLGNRGTTLLRAALELPGVEIAALSDLEPKHRLRGQGIVEKARKTRPEAVESADALLERSDVHAVVVALPCDLHAGVYANAVKAGKHLYAEKPLALTLRECDALIAESFRAPQTVVHVGFQRRLNPRYRDGVELLRRGDLGRLIEARASWTSSNGPVSGHLGWLGSRERSGDWMVEQAVHVWDLFHWIAGGPPVEANGWGERNVFSRLQPGRDVTDYYSVALKWPNGFHASLTHSWIEPADDAFTGVHQRVVGSDGGFDFSSGVATFRDRDRGKLLIHPGSLPDTRLALAAFFDAVRADEPTAPPISLAEARAATLTGLLVRKAVDERRAVSIDELAAES